MRQPPSFNLRLRARLVRGRLTVTPEPPLPGSDCFTRLDRFVARWREGTRRVAFDARHYRSFDSRNLRVIALLHKLFSEAGIEDFSISHLPKRGRDVLEALGMSELLEQPLAA